MIFALIVLRIYRPDEDKYDDSKKVLTERRRMQLEKIRAMAAELKPSRGRSRGNGRGIRSGAVSRGSLKPRGRCRILRTEVCYFYHLCSVTFFVYLTPIIVTLAQHTTYFYIANVPWRFLCNQIFRRPDNLCWIF